MTVHLPAHAYSWLSVPKCGSTSLKWAFFRFENGFDFRPFVANGVGRHIHNAAYPFVPFGKLRHRRIAGHARACIVRDPVSRLVSCYADRVVGRGDLARLEIPPEMRARGVTESPDFDRFVEFLPDYRRLSPVLAHHCEPLSHFLGTDPGWFERVFPIAAIADFVAWTEARIGAPLDPGHRMASAARHRPPDPGAGTLRRIEAHYAEDIRLFGRWFG